MKQGRQVSDRNCQLFRNQNKGLTSFKKLTPMDKQELISEIELLRDQLNRATESNIYVVLHHIENLFSDNVKDMIDPYSFNEIHNEIIDAKKEEYSVRGEKSKRDKAKNLRNIIERIDGQFERIINSSKER